MNSFNKVILVGNLTRDPEVKYLPRGTACASFGLAVNKKYMDEGQPKEVVSFFDVVVYGKPAENCGKYIGKGSGVLIEGELRQRRWESDGKKHSKIEVVAAQVNFMTRRNSDAGTVPPGVREAFPDSAPVDEGDIPF